MRRKKRLTIIRVGLAFAALAIPATAQAKPMPTEQAKAQYQIGPIPYLSQGQGVDQSQFRAWGVSPDDRSVVRGEVAQQSTVIPYLSQGEGVTSAELGFPAAKSPDDRAFSRAKELELTPVASDDGSTIDVNPYAVGGVGIALVLLMGTGLAVRHNRKSTLSPA